MGELGQPYFLSRRFPSLLIHRDHDGGPCSQRASTAVASRSGGCELNNTTKPSSRGLLSPPSLGPICTHSAHCYRYSAIPPCTPESLLTPRLTSHTALSKDPQPSLAHTTLNMGLLSILPASFSNLESWLTRIFVSALVQLTLPAS